MPDSRHETEAPSLPLQGPHRRPDVAPLRLRLRPGTFAVEVTRSGTVLGRHSSADVRLPLPDVSRRHCRFVYQGGHWEVIDLDSLNGIYVNEALVPRAELHPGDTLRIGGFIFDVELRDGHRPAEVGGAADSGGMRRAS